MINAIRSIEGTVWYYVVIILCIIMLTLVFICTYNAAKFLKKYSIVSRTVNTLYSKTSKSSEEREKRAEHERMINGYTENTLIIERIDKMIMYSGIKSKIKWINTEIVIYAMLFISAVVLVTVTTVYESIILGLVAFALTFIAIYCSLLIADNIQYRRVENTLTEFLGVTQNFSSSSNDLMSIFSMSIPYLREPIRSAVIECVSTARNSGNISEAMGRLEDSIEHKHFKMIIRNLETCTKHGADYSKIIDESKMILDSELKFESKIRAKYNNGRMQVLGLFAIGIIALKAFEGMAPSDVSAFTIIRQSPIYDVALIYITFTIIYCFYICIIKPFKH